MLQTIKAWLFFVHLIHEDHFTFVLASVDDLIIVGTSLEKIEDLKKYLGSCFKLKDLRVLKYFLGMEVAWSTSGIFLSIRKYVHDILKDTSFLGEKVATFSMEQVDT